MYHFIINPNASGGKGSKVWQRVEKELSRRGIEYEAYLTRESGDAKKKAAELTDGRKEPFTIVAVGGDGTVNEVVDGLLSSGPVTLGYVPAGSGNDLARSLRLPKKPEKCLQKILNAGNRKLLDYGIIAYGERSGHRRFMVSSGIGMDAAVCEEIHRLRAKKGIGKVHLNRWRYLVIGVRQLWKAKPVKGYLLLDGTKKVEFDHIYFVSAHIHPYEGGGFKFAPDADPCDGKLTLRVIHQDRKLLLVPILLGALRGSRKNYRGSRIYSCQEAEIHVERPMPVHMDGESCMRQQEIQLRCIPRKVRMIV